MDKLALELFLAESTAVAVVGEFDALGSMASALNKRHKVRQTDLLDLFELAQAQGPNTFERAILVFYLMILGGGAYDDPMNIIQAGDLKNLRIKPHWDASGLHNFDTVCIWEPMNLWAGWANENQSNNNTTIDPHMLNFFQNCKVVFTDITPQKTNTTPNMTLANHFLPDATARTSWTYGGVAKRERRYSAHSDMLVRQQQHIQYELDNFQHLAKPNTDSSLAAQELQRYMDNIGILESQSTTAGTQHYIELLDSLTARNLANLDFYNKIDDARQRWISNRAKLRIIIDDWTQDLRNGVITGGMFYKPQAKGIPNPKKSKTFH